MKEEFSFLALGLDGAGKSTLISKLCGEIAEEIEPTSGWYSKCPTNKFILSLSLCLRAIVENDMG